MTILSNHSGLAQPDLLLDLDLFYWSISKFSESPVIVSLTRSNLHTHTAWNLALFLKQCWVSRFFSRGSCSSAFSSWVRRCQVLIILSLHLTTYHVQICIWVKQPVSNGAVVNIQHFTSYHLCPWSYQPSRN